MDFTPTGIQGIQQEYNGNRALKTKSHDILIKPSYYGNITGISTEFPVPTSPFFNKSIA